MGEVNVIGKNIPAINAPRYPKLPNEPKNASKTLKYVRAVANKMDTPNKIKFGYLIRNFIYYPLIVTAPSKQAKSHLEVAPYHKPFLLKNLEG